MRYRTRILVLISLLLPAATASAGIIVVPNTLTVGGDGPCDYNDLQDAIDNAATGDTIRVQALNYIVPTGFSIINRSLTVVGGFSNCSDTTSDPDTPTTVSISGTDTALTVGSVIAGRQNVLIRNFVLRLGTGGANKGGGVDLSGGVDLRLDNVDVYSNSATNGGGIHIHGGVPNPTLRLEGGSVIGGTAPFTGNNNATQNGGGIYCSGGGLIEWVNASINFNTAFTGGGLYLQDCQITTPTFNTPGLHLVEIRGNRSLQQGGGMVLLANSTANLSSQANRLIGIIGNYAEFNGGGIRATGSDLTLLGVHIEENSSNQSGAGVSLNGSQFSLTRGAADGSNCPLPPHCATIRRNVAAGSAGAIHAVGTSLVLLQDAFIESNQSDSTAAFLLNDNSNFTLRNLQIAGNTATNGGGTRLFYVNNAILNMRNVTAALNSVHAGFELEANANLVMNDSILWQPASTLVTGDGSATLDFSCNNASDLTVTGAATHEPGFRNVQTVGRDQPILRLAPGSQNIDRCDLVPAPPASDLAGAMRVTDVASVVNAAGPLDRGAFEYEPPLFSDSYESE